MTAFSRAACLTVLTAWWIAGVHPTTLRAQQSDEEIEALINQLPAIEDSDIGYSATRSGSGFLPLNVSDSSMLLLGQAPPESATTMRDIVKQGAAAIPRLIEHLADDRPTKIELEHGGGFGAMYFSDEYDFNSLNSEAAPKNVNTDQFATLTHVNNYKVTVGDLCFVALGQIVNRSFSAVRYQPTAIIVINSPAQSEALREAVKEEWANVDEEQLKESLIRDFVQADYESRRIAAYQRLAYYYPEAVEDLVLTELAKPTFDVFLVNDLCRDTLYKTDDFAVRKQKYDEFIQKHGEVFAAGIKDQLFDDLDLLEAHERGAISPPLTRFGTQPRELLIQLFGEPEDVKSEDQPILDVASESERARFIRALVHDESRKIGEAVKQVFLTSPDDDYLAPACLRCLANRGFGPFLVEQLDKIDFADRSINYLHKEYLEAICHSSDTQVQAKLVEIIKTTANDVYFMSALSAVSDLDADLVSDRAVAILNGLPDETDQGRELLGMIRKRFPDEAKEVFESFLRAKTPQRAETLCRVLWYNDPLAIEILAPLLDDKRPLEGFSIPMRVCDRAAQAISHTTEDISFDSEWSISRKDSTIQELKQYCKDKGK